MNHKILLVALLSISSFTIFSQIPEEVRVLSSPDGPDDCTDTQNAGTIDDFISFPSTQSNDTQPDTLFLCAEDSILVQHNNDFVLDGDPDPATPGEVGYAFYNCAPSVIGEELASITADPCVINDPPSPIGIYIARGMGPSDASILLYNDGSQQAFFNDGDPFYFQLAPITFDAYNGQPQYENNGSCVNVNIFEAFELVYLNPISVQSQIATGLDGTFELEGGLPEFNPTANYSGFSVVNVDDASITGSVPPGNYSQGDEIPVNVPEEGTYLITAEDGKSCPVSFEMTFSTDIVFFDIGEMEVNLGDNFCIPVSVANFDSITSFQVVINFNPNVIRYDTIQNWSLSTSGGFFLVSENDADQGLVRLSWQSQNVSEGESLPDGALLTEFCFTTAPGAEPGDMTSINFISNGPTDFEVIGGADSEEKITSVDPGKVTIVSSDLTITASSCGSLPGRTDGTLDIRVFEGSPPYDVVISGPANENGTINNANGSITFDDLPPGNYLITITDDNGESTSINQTVYDGGVAGQPRPVFDFRSIGHPRCYSTSDGHLAIDIESGNVVPPYQIEWSTNEFNKDSIFGLTRGTYFVTVIDSFGCEAVRNATLSTPQISLNANLTPPSCSGYSNGTALMTASGGTPAMNGDYTFRWSVGGGGSGVGNDALITNIGEGTFEVTVEDANGCIGIDSFEVTASRQIILDDLMATAPTCNGGSDGTISVIAATIGGSENLPYTIRIIDELGTDRAVLVGDTEANATGLSSGEYIIEIEDNSSPDPCAFDTTIVLDDPDPMVLDVSKTDETCPPGSNDGTATINVSGGTAPYDYLWPGGLANSSSQSNLAPGTYEVTVEDDNGCTQTVSFEILEAMPPQVIDVTMTPPSCPESCDGTITIEVEPNPSFDIVRYRIQRPGGALDTLTDATTLTIGGFCSGQLFEIREIEDEAGCIYNPGTFDVFPTRDSLIVDSTNAPIITDPSCAGSEDGSIEIFMDGGAPPYVFDWENRPTDTVNGPLLVEDLAAGTYNVTVNDINECGAVELSFTLMEPDSLSVDISGIDSASCFNSCDGRATAMASGGRPPMGDYYFEWSSEATTTGGNIATATDLCAGDGFVIIEAGACRDTFSLNIPAPPEMDLQLTAANDPTCFGETDGSLEVNATGGSGGFTYDWINGPGDTRWDSIGAGEYIHEVTDRNGCSLRDTFQLSAPDSLIAQILPDDILDPSCPGETDGMLTVTASGGNGPSYTYQWSGTTSTSNEASALTDGRYAVTVSDAEGCRDTTSATLVTNPPLEAVFAIPTTPDCAGASVPFTIEAVSGGGGAPYQFTVGNNPLTPIGDTVNIEEGEQQINIVDSNGCTLDTSVTVPEQDSIVIELAADQELQLGETLQFFPEASGPFPIVSYEWTPADGLSCTDCQYPEVAPGSNTTYTLTVTDQQGCTNTATVNVVTNSQRNVYIPNVFTPNADEINDVFRIYTGPGVTQISTFQVFDRWGNLVFERRNLLPSSDGSEGWDGTVNGRMVDPGTFIYVAKIEFLDGVSITFKGDVTVPTVRK